MSKVKAFLSFKAFLYIFIISLSGIIIQNFQDAPQIQSNLSVTVIPVNKDVIYHPDVKLDSFIDYRTHLHPGFIKQEMSGHPIKLREPLPLELSDESPVIFGEEENSDGTTGLLSEIRCMGIDSRENLIIIDWNQSSIMRFNKNGTPLPFIGHEGPGGPGDFLIPAALTISCDDTLLIFDQQLERFSLISNELKCTTNFRFTHYLTSDWLYSDSHNNVYCMISDYSDSNRLRWQSLDRFDLSGQNKTTIASYNWQDYKGSVWGWNIDPYFPSIYLTGLKNDRIVFINNTEPNLYIVKTVTNTISIIPLDIRQISLTDEEFDYIKNGYRRGLKKMRLTPYLPYFRKVLSDEFDTIYLVRMKSILNTSKEWEIDVFNPDGHYLNSFKSPYEPEAIKYGSMYVNSEDTNGEVILKKFKLKTLIHSSNLREIIAKK